MQEVISSGKATFKLGVAYKLVDTGEAVEKPLIVYLHGFNQNMEQFRKLMADLQSLEAYHLFIQGPYPIYDRRHRKKVEDWGRAWYLYDGEQEQFVKSLERSSEFIQALIDKLLKNISANRISLVGYSMGGYLAGYYALSRWKYVNDFVIIGGRIKTELFEDRERSFEHMNVLALHGRKDESVKSSPQKKCCKQLSQWGANVTFKELEKSHALSDDYVDETKQWFLSKGFS